MSSCGVTTWTLLGSSKILSASALATPLPARMSMVFFRRDRYSSKYYCFARAMNSASPGVENRHSIRAASSSSIRAAKTEMTADPGSS